MLFLLSPAKSLDYDTPTPPELAPALTRPQFLPDTARLIDVLRTKSVADVRELMDLSEPLAQLNVDRYRAWRPRFTDHNSKPAVLAFNGDVYDGLDAKSLTADDLAWAQTHVCMHAMSDDRVVLLHAVGVASCRAELDSMHDGQTPYI